MVTVSIHTDVTVMCNTASIIPTLLSCVQVTLSISILTSLYVFFLLVVEIIPPTSLVVPLLGKYLIFAMILVSLRLVIYIIIYNPYNKKIR